MDSLKLGSLFDGSGGFPLGGLLCGITPVWAAEIEPFPIRVTTKRLPQMKHLGDVCAINGAEIEPVDIITFGSPCTDMSCAGKRAGLGGKQSSLFYQAIRIIKEMRDATDGQYPRWICWENVVGAFSSNAGIDFKSVLDAVIGIVEPGAAVPMPAKNRWPYADVYMGDGWSVAYRTLDARYWGIPQRRKRIYLVADFGGRGAGQVLFESEGVSGYSAESFRAWQRAAGAASDCAGEAGCLCLNDQGGICMDISTDVSGTLRAQMAGHPPCILDLRTEHSAQAVVTLYENHPQDSRYTGPLTAAPTISGNYGTGGNNQPFVLRQPKTYDVRFTSEGTKNARQNVYETEISHTIDTGGNAPDSNQGGVAVVSDSKTYSITPCSYMQVVEEQVPTLTARDFKGPTMINRGCSVRRLIPGECAKLQGFPAWWCAGLETENPTEADISFWTEVWETHRRAVGTSSRPKSRKQIVKWLQSPYLDSAEYKMWGNGVPLPCVFFVLAGIVWSTQISNR